MITNYINVKFLEQGSFITCFTAVNSDNEKVVLIVSDNIQELQTRFDLARKLGDIEGVQKLYGLQKLEIQDSALEQLEAEYPGIFSKDSHVLTGRYYATQYNDHVRQLSLPQKLDFFRELLVLVKQIHDKGVYHMDLKPSNIMVQDGKPVLIDFGQSVTEAEVDSVLNTSAYAPKHDVYSCNVIPEKFDIYCLGNMLHEIYTGQPLGYPMTPSSRQAQQIKQTFGLFAQNIIGQMTQRIQDLRISLESCLKHPLFVYKQETSLEKSQQILSEYVFCLYGDQQTDQQIEGNKQVINTSSSYSSSSFDVPQTLNQTTTNTTNSLRDLFGNVTLSRINSCILSVQEESQQ
ncbi:Kinase [Hexamita inflata]|uniref:CAMK CAMKL n=1 Tax=Hexamita inflata TaxID=28002 RepID=A0AA86QXC5_9EUKA|nr:CAMK CAMKL [Hexamita inflata]